MPLCGGSISFHSLCSYCWEFYGVYGDGPEVYWRGGSSLFFFFFRRVGFFINISLFFFFLRITCHIFSSLGLLLPFSVGSFFLLGKFKLCQPCWSPEPLCCWAEDCFSLLRSKAGCIPTSKRFIGQLSPVIRLAGWRTVTSVISCINVLAFRRQWICLIKPWKLSLRRHTIAWATPCSKQAEPQRQ